MLSIVLVCALLTYGGVSLFVVVFAVYPFAAEMFRQGGIPKRLIPATIALGAFTFTMDALPGTPQIQNIIPTTFFKTDTWAAPWLGVIGAALHPGHRARVPRVAAAAGGSRRRRLRHEARQRARALSRGEATEPLARPLAPRHRRRDEQAVHGVHSPLLRRAPIPRRCPASRSRWSPRFPRWRRSGRWKARFCSAS